MGILGQCYACGIRVKHGDIAVAAGLEIVCRAPWRARYAARTNGGHTDGRAIVILCSDRCEVDYGRKVGYAPDCGEATEISTSK